jgi:hypothetical protein
MLAQRTANIWKIPKVGVFNYFLRCLSCVLQKSHVNSINKRHLNLITGIMTDQATAVNRSIYFESMMDSMNVSASIIFSYSKLILSLECLSHLTHTIKSSSKSHTAFLILSYYLFKHFIYSIMIQNHQNLHPHKHLLPLHS